MKKIVTYTLFIFIVYTSNINAQIDADNLLGLPTATDLAEITGVVGPQIGALVYNLDDEQVYRFTSTGWQVSTDDQNASEVLLVTNVDADGDGTVETTVEDIIQDIAPITSKAARIFYPPSIAINASTTGTGRTVNLYEEYENQFTLTNLATSASSIGAPGTIPTYTADELYYYVTFYDNTILTINGITADGVMTYSVDNVPPDQDSLINVVFVVK